MKSLALLLVAATTAGPLSARSGAFLRETAALMLITLLLILVAIAWSLGKKRQPVLPS